MRWYIKRHRLSRSNFCALNIVELIRFNLLDLECFSLCHRNNLKQSWKQYSKKLILTPTNNYLKTDKWYTEAKWPTRRSQKIHSAHKPTASTQSSHLQCPVISLRFLSITWFWKTDKVLLPTWWFHWHQVCLLNWT